MDLNTIGEKLQTKRKNQNLSIDEVVSNTKMRRSYVIALENNEFNKFDSHVYAKGFIKNYANFLEMDSKNLLAMYRRDYQNTSIKRSINKDLDKKIAEKESKFNFKKIQPNPRQISYAIFGFILVVLIMFVINFINKAFTPPYLKITTPVEINGNSNQTIDVFDNQLIIKGETQSYVLIKINDVPISLKSGFQFESAPLPITSLKNIYVITATSQVGVVSTIKLEVNKKSNTDSKAFIGMDCVLSILSDNVILNIKSDDLVQFNGEGHANDEFPIKAKNKIEIKTSKPNNIKLVINNNVYKLIKTNEIFDFIDGKIKQR